MAKALMTAVLCAITLQLAAGTAHCAAGKAVAIAVYVSGDVKVKHAGAEGPVLLKVGDDLFLEDSVETGSDGKASLALIYGAELRINENSVLEFVPGKGLGLVSLNAGQVWTRILHKRTLLEIRTPAAVCSIRGTETDIEQRQRLTVKVYEGHVDVKNTAGTVTLKAGEITRVVGIAAPPARPVKMGEHDAGQWQVGVTSEDIYKFLEKLQNGGGPAALDLTVGKSGKAGKDVRIRLKKKEAGK